MAESTKQLQKKNLFETGQKRMRNKDKERLSSGKVRGHGKERTIPSFRTNGEGVPKMTGGKTVGMAAKKKEKKKGL